MLTLLITWITSFILIIGIWKGYSAKEGEWAFLGRSRWGVILILAAIILVVVNSFKTITDLNKARIIESRRNEKLIYIAQRTNNAMNLIYGFLSPFLDAYGKRDLIKIFNEDHEDVLGTEYPDPSLMDPIMDIFSQASWYAPSNMTQKGKKIHWLGLLFYTITDISNECDLIMRDHGNLDHSIIIVVANVRVRAENLLFVIETVATYPDSKFKEVWGEGIHLDQYIDFLRYFLLEILKCKRISRNILDSGGYD